MSDRLARNCGPNHQEIQRRDFLGLAGLWASGLAVLGSVIGMAKLTKPAVLPEAGKRFRIGSPEDFPPGTEQTIKEQNVLVISDKRGIAAISLVCTHLGCIVTRLENGFACPCHGSKFGPQGDVLAGPAPRTLRWFAISTAVNGLLVVDAKQEVPPGTFYKA